MRTCHCLVILLLSLLSRVCAERPVRVIATIPNESLLAKGSDQFLVEGDGDTRSLKDVEVTGFITKNGDLFEIEESRGMGSIESRQEPEPGMSMCRYGTIVVYSDADCNTFIKTSFNLEAPVKTESSGDQTDAQEVDEKPLKKKKKKKTKGNRRKLNKNRPQKRRKSNKRKGGNKNRRRNQKRRKNLKNKQRRGNRNNGKRKRINRREEPETTTS